MLSLYGTYYPTDRLYVDAVGSVGIGNYDSKRLVVIDSTTTEPAENRTARGDFDSWIYGASITAGYDYPVWQGLTITPSAGLDYLHADIGSFKETGAGGLNLDYDDQNLDSLVSSVGVQLAYPISFNFGVLSPYVRGTWFYDLSGNDDGVEFRFKADPTDLSSFEMKPVDQDRSYGSIEAGLSSALPRGFSLFAEYGTLVGLDDVTQHRLVAGLRKTF
jgi:outer membrane autotransporter protein